MQFFRTFGVLPRTTLTVMVMVVSGLCEGFGITLFVPVLELINGGDTSSWVMRGMERVFSVVGLPVSMPAILVFITTLLFAAYALNYLQARLLLNSYLRMVAELRDELFRNTFHAKWEYLSRRPHGEVINHLLLECMRYGQLLMYQVRIVATAILLVIYAGVSAMLSWQLLIVVFVLAGLFMVAIRPLLLRAKELGDETTEANQGFNFHIVDYLRSAKLIKVTAAEPAVTDKFASLNEDLRKVTFNSENITELTYFMLQSLPIVTLAGIIYVASELLGMETAFILTFLIIMARMMPRLAQLQLFHQQYLLRLPVKPVIDEVIADSRATTEVTSADRRGFLRLEKEITLDRVSFSYPDSSQTALHDVSLKIGHRKLIALVGSSGSGKSTVVDILAGLRRPDDGAVLIDGVDLREIDLASWRKRIGYVTQETTVFNDTVRNNLLFVNPDASDTDIAESLEAAHLDEVVRLLPSGLDTVLGEGGMVLSGGERQRLALARALISRPELLLLDEATSALDNESERIVQTAIENIAGHLTVLVVAHRLTTVRKADTIYVLEYGRIVESGSYTDLVERGGRFSELHQLQFS